MAIRTSEQAKAAIKRDAAARALTYIEGEIPATLEAIVFLVNEGNSESDITGEIERAYDITEGRLQHKLRLVVAAAIQDREN